MDSAEPSSHKEVWDDDQIRVISSAPDARLLVEAGPGTGKTAVACARLAHLINEDDVEPSNTWMISFTRTAVAEIRARLYAYTGENSFAIRIATVDSHAWSIHSGHDPDARLTGSYEKNIERVIELLKTDEDVAYELAQIEHVVIDEAQDLVGLRADLVEALIERLSQDCGVTVFADEAQAIYGFSDTTAEQNNETAINTKGSLLDRLRVAKKQNFTTLFMHQIHRTSSPGLKKIFSEVREEILATQNQRSGLHAETAKKIRDLSDWSGLKWRDMNINDFSADDLLLFRTRAEVLIASQFCKFPHRLRLSGYSSTLPSWLALCFYDIASPFLSEHTFLDLWSSRVESNAATEYSPSEAWKRLKRVAGKKDGSIDMQRLRRRLSQAKPPVELALTEFGLYGPIVGTIHASKGRESNNVVLLLPKISDFNDVEDEIEEARVLFVGATRACTYLIVGESNSTKASSLPSGRSYRLAWNRKSTMVEFGRDGDITARSLVGRSEFNSSDAAKAQSFLAKVSDVVTTYSLKADPDLDWRYRILSDNDQTCVGAFSRNIVFDLWEILDNRNQRQSHKPPFRINHVNSQGCSTIVLASDDSELETLNEPWASSGFMLAPRISAYPSLFFNKR